jgi:hypothetical protein
MAQRPPEEETLHEEVIKFIKSSVYPYPNPARPSLMTFSNHPQITKPLKLPSGEECYPDLVIVNTEINKVVMVGEVETLSTLDEEEAQEWQKFSLLSTVFYLFYPKGEYETIRRLCERIMVTGFFEYELQNNKYRLTRHWPSFK